MQTLKICARKPENREHLLPEVVHCVIGNFETFGDMDDLLMINIANCVQTGVGLLCTEKGSGGWFFYSSQQAFCNILVPRSISAHIIQTSYRNRSERTCLFCQYFQLNVGHMPMAIHMLCYVMGKEIYLNSLAFSLKYTQFDAHPLCDVPHFRFHKSLPAIK